MRITPRDLLMLEFVTEQGVATADQITERFFPNKDCFWSRVRPLLKNGYLSSESLLAFASDVPSRMLPLLKSMREQKKQVERLKVYSIGEKFKTLTKSTLDVTSRALVQHQLGLNEIRSFLELVLPKGGFYFTDPDIRREQKLLGSAKEALIPDLVWRTDSHQFAFELERNQKSRERYFERFGQYERSPYSRVLYFCENEFVYDKLIEHGARFPKMGFSLSYRPSKVFSQFRHSLSISDFLAIDRG